MEESSMRFVAILYTIWNVVSLDTIFLGIE